MAEILTLAQMAANVELSRGHIMKQDAIILRLTEQGHDAMANEAKAMLPAMHQHLAFELEMLARMQSDADSKDEPQHLAMTPFAYRAGSVLSSSRSYPPVEQHEGYSIMDRDAEAWLKQWVEEHLGAPQYAAAKSELQPDARLCVEHADEAGFTVAQVKDAAGGDLERYLMKVQNDFTDREVERKSGENQG